MGAVLIESGLRPLRVYVRAGGRFTKGFSRAKTPHGPRVHSKNRCTFCSPKANTICLMSGNANAMWIAAVTSGRKNMSSTCVRMVALTSFGVMPTCCMMRKRPRSS